MTAALSRIKEVKTESLANEFAKVILALALVGGLFAAGWSVYRRLPGDAPDQFGLEGLEPSGETELTITTSGEFTGASVDIRLYRADLVREQRDSAAAPKSGKGAEDPVTQPAKPAPPVRAQLDNHGRATMKLAEGNWSLRATALLANGEQILWRLPIKIAGGKQTVELSSDNTSERTKKF